MNKIEHTFGSYENSQEFLAMARGNLVLRMSTTKLPSQPKNEQSHKYEVTLGRAGDMAKIIEPTSDHIPEACLKMPKLILTTITLRDYAFKVPDIGNYIHPKIELKKFSALRIQNPIITPDQLRQEAIKLTRQPGERTQAITTPHYLRDDNGSYNAFTILNDQLQKIQSISPEQSQKNSILTKLAKLALRCMH